MALGRFALEDVLGAAVRADHFAGLQHVEKDARMLATTAAQPGCGQCSGRSWAVTSTVLLSDILISLNFLDVGQPVVVLGGAAINHVEILGLDLAVIGPRRPMPIWRLSSSRIGVTSAAVPVKKASSAAIDFVAGDALFLTEAQFSAICSTVARVMPSRQEVRSGVYSLPFLTMNRFSPAPSAT
jgi:hypothetical protein